TLDPVELGRKLASRPPGVAQAAIAAMDAWALIRRYQEGGVPGARRLLAAARAADADPWRNRLRDALEHNDLEAFPPPAEAKAPGEEGPISRWLLGYSLEVLGDHTRAVGVLRQVQRAYPGDLWLNVELGMVLLEGKRRGPGTAKAVFDNRIDAKYQ